MSICVLYGFKYEERLFQYTALTDRLLLVREWRRWSLFTARYAFNL